MEMTRLLETRARGRPGADPNPASSAAGHGGAVAQAGRVAEAEAEEEQDEEKEEDEEDEEESSDWDEESDDEQEAAGPRFEEVGRFLWWLSEATPRRTLLLEGTRGLPPADGSLLLSAMRAASLVTT